MSRILEKCYVFNINLLISLGKLVGEISKLKIQKLNTTINNAMSDAIHNAMSDVES